MDDCSAELKAWLMGAEPKADAGCSPPSPPSAVRVFDAPPVGAKGDYIILDAIHIIPVRGSDAGNGEVQFSVMVADRSAGNGEGRPRSATA
jgi:hypothetical protein